MEKITLIKGNNSTWNVKQGENIADHLTWDEMLGLVAQLTMPNNKNCLQWMKPDKPNNVGF